MIRDWINPFKLFRFLFPNGSLSDSVLYPKFAALRKSLPLSNLGAKLLFSGISFSCWSEVSISFFSLSFNWSVNTCADVSLMLDEESSVVKCTLSFPEFQVLIVLPEEVNNKPLRAFASAFSLARIVTATFSALNAAIRRMKGAGLISSRRDGPDHVYFLNKGRYRELQNFVNGLLSG